MHDLILLRHGESQWNLENRFTGWVDVPLSERGISEAKQAGKMLKAECCVPKVMYTSLLDRAIHTGQLVLREMNRSWLPVKRTWRLNERHYGDLQGLDKSETAKKYGDEQVLIWRRSFDIPPPQMSLESDNHPRHDEKYHGIPTQLLPCGESLKDTRQRVLPFLQDELLPSVLRNNTPVVAAHGNSLRAIVMELDGMSADEVLKLNIPTGVPILYSISDSGHALNRKFLGDQAQVQAMMEQVARQGSSA